MVKVECATCKRTLLRKRKRNGALCNTCRLTRARKYYWSNRESKIEHVRKYRKDNKDLIQAKKRKKYKEDRERIIRKARKYYRDNSIEILKKGKIYRAKNVEKILVRNRNRKALMRTLKLTSDISNGFLSDILNKAKKCPMCKKYFKNKSDKHVDHIKPIGVGGLHMRDNVRVICRRCNLTRPRK